MMVLYCGELFGKKCIFFLELLQSLQIGTVECPDLMLEHVNIVIHLFTQLFSAPRVAQRGP